MTSPKLNIFEAPLIYVIELANIPPVQDSATESFNFFLVKRLTKDFIKSNNYLTT